MGIFIKLLLFLVLLAVALPFVMKDKDGQPLMTASKLEMPDIGLQGMVDRVSSKDISLPDISTISSDIKTVLPNKTKIYSWRDKEGNMHFTNVPPENGGETDTMQVNPNMNVMQTSKPPQEEVVDSPKKEDSGVPDAQSLYTPEGINRLLEDAKNVEAVSRQRIEEHNRIIDER